jgi:hypothetical protein
MEGGSMKAKVKVEKVRLSAWDLAAIEAALRKFEHGDGESIARLVKTVAWADGGFLSRRIATETGKERA